MGSTPTVLGHNLKINMSKMPKFLNQQEAINIDKELFSTYKFSVDQLMELAGLSCATAIAKCYPIEKLCNGKVLVCCGPGNNGGDGLVCARHLKLFGYNPVVYYPKTTDNQLYCNLMHQCCSMGIPIISDLEDMSTFECTYKLIVDALFGFSFKPPVRPLFVPIIEIMKKTKIPIAR